MSHSEDKGDFKFHVQLVLEALEGHHNPVVHFAAPLDLVRSICDATGAPITEFDLSLEEEFLKQTRPLGNRASF